MNDLFRALKQKYAADQGDGTAYALTGGRFWRSRAREKGGYPYVVVNLIGGNIDWIFGDKQIEGYRVQLTVVDEFKGSAREAMSVWQALQRCFERQTIAMEDTFLVMRREGLPTEQVESDHVVITGDYLVEIYVT